MALKISFWKCQHTARRATVNTLRCLAGCSVGDYTALAYLNIFHPEISPFVVMPIAMASGITTSLVLESTLLTYGVDQMPFRKSVSTALNMSFISMLSMELAENAVELSITGGNFAADPTLAVMALVPATAAGFFAAFPYNYYRLKKYGKSCH